MLRILTDSERAERAEEASVKFAAGLNQLLQELTQLRDDDELSVGEMREMLGSFRRAETFDESELVTRDAGVVVGMAGGVELQVSVVQSK